MEKKLKKQIIYLGIGFATLFLVSIIFKELILISATKTCGYFYKVGTSRYVDYYHYTYSINGNRYNGSILENELKIKSFNKLKKINCVEIKYSNYIKSYSKIVDERILIK